MTTPKQILINLTDLSSALKADCDSAYKLVNSSDGQFERRTVVRVLFSFVEGMVHQLKKAALEIHHEMSEKIIKDKAEKEIPLLWERFKPAISWKDISIIEETIPDLDRNGLPTEKPYYPTFIKNLRFSFYVFEKVYHSEFRPNYDEDGWEKLQIAVGIRNRITHPKKGQDLAIEPNDLEVVCKGFQWFQANVSTMFSDLKITLENLQDEVNLLFKDKEGA